MPAVLGAQDASTQELPNADVAREAIARLRSPYCPGFMLEVCPSPQAEALRDSIYMLAAQGESRDEIVEWMVGNHGEEWRGMPKRSGAGLLAWIVPPIALLAGIGAFLFWLKSSRNPAKPEPLPEDGSGMSEAERNELAAAMKTWETTPQDDS